MDLRQQASQMEVANRKSAKVLHSGNRGEARGRDMEKVAIFGGTFNPVHWGHLQIAQTALTQVQLHRVIWVSDRRPPQKNKHCGVDVAHRRAMVSLAIASEPAFVLAPPPLSPPDRSYAIATFHHLQHLYPHTQWYWIIGADAFQTLPKWYGAAELAPACQWLVAPRPPIPSPPDSTQALEMSIPPTDAATLEEKDKAREIRVAETETICQQVATQLEARRVALGWQILTTPALGVSSSDIRRHWRDRPEIRKWVPPPVRIYIETHQLYQNPSHPLPPESDSIPTL